MTTAVEAKPFTKDEVREMFYAHAYSIIEEAEFLSEYDKEEFTYNIPELEFNNRKSYLGRCEWEAYDFYARRIIITEQVLEKGNYDVLEEVMTHEIAHYIAGRNSGHDKNWKRIYIGLGGNGQRICQSAGDLFKKKEFKYTATCQHCGHHTGYSRKLKLSRSCGKCSPGVYNDAYKMVITQNW